MRVEDRKCFWCPYPTGKAIAFKDIGGTFVPCSDDCRLRMVKEKAIEDAKVARG
jgi:hypothetical protein